MQKLQTEKHTGHEAATLEIVGDRAGLARNYFSKAVQYQNENEVGKAVACYAKAIEAHPAFAEANYNIGVIRYGQRNWGAAITHFQRALEIKPGFIDAIFNLAAAYKESGDFHQAALTYRKVIQIDSDIADAAFYLGICLLRVGKTDQATRSLLRAVRLDPQNPVYWFHLAESHVLQQSIDNAIACYQRAIALKPDWDSAYYNIAVAFRTQGRLEEAISHLTRSVEINPGFSAAHAFLLRLAQHACDWPLAADSDQNLSRLTAMELAAGTTCAESPMTSIRRTTDPAMNGAVAKSWSRRVAMQIGAAASRAVFNHIPHAARRIRIGYLSNDFKDHAVSHQVRGMLENHDRHQFEIYGYAINPDDGTRYRKLMSNACDHFKTIHQINDLAAAQQIHEDGIHILVDMGGHSRDSRLGITALRPAPIQVSYLGFLGTTGADFIDYIVADRIVVPPEHAVHYTENLVYLPHCYQANDNQMPIVGHQFHRKEFNLPNSGFIYSCFNQPYKIDQRLFSTWLKILRQVDGSFLWLVKRSPLAQTNLRRAAESAGVDPQRLIFADFLPIEENLARLRLADLALDTLIYNGGATTANALWAGVPVLTMLGGHWVSRMSASALSAVGLPELIAGSLEDYGNKAVQLALHRDKLDALRTKLADHRQTWPLFDTPSFTRHMEQAYQYMYQRYLNRLKPAPFKVDA